jgi:hypothetical protein
MHDVDGRVAPVAVKASMAISLPRRVTATPVTSAVGEPALFRPPARDSDRSAPRAPPTTSDGLRSGKCRARLLLATKGSGSLT